MRYIEIDARNAYFTKESLDLFSEMEERAQNQFVKKYINTNLKKFFINDWDPGNNRFVIPVTKVKESSPKWLKEALDRKDKVYEIYIPHSLYKDKLLHTVDYLNTLPPRPISIPVKDLESRVAQWDKKLKDSKSLKIQEDGIELLHDYKNGFKWVKVFGKESLNREGHLMRHCVGSYYNQVKDEKCEIYSLRDGNNKPHVTIEYRNETITQIKGNSNQPPKDEYLKYVNDFLKKKYISFKKIKRGDLHRSGMIYQDNQIYRLESLPEGFVIKGDLNLDYLEKDLKLPDGIIINGDMSSVNSNITSLPKNLTVKGDFYATGSELTHVPKSCKFFGDVHIVDCDKLKEWKVKEIGGNFNAFMSALKVLPDNFKVNGVCDLGYTNIERIESIIVDSDLILDKCKKLRSLGHSIDVGGTLFLPDKVEYYREHIDANKIVGGIEIEPDDEEDE